ncbi:hypothetical protein GCM10009526_11290 [Glutamicibacter creatinolyticus]
MTEPGAVCSEFGDVAKDEKALRLVLVGGSGGKAGTAVETGAVHQISSDFSCWFVGLDTHYCKAVTGIAKFYLDAVT